MKSKRNRSNKLIGGPINNEIDFMSKNNSYHHLAVTLFACFTFRSSQPISKKPFPQSINGKITFLFLIKRTK